MKKVIFSIIILAFALAPLMSQEMSNGHFLVEFAKFSPPIKDLVRNFEGKPAEPFLASDVAGVEHYLPNYKGKDVILWFWSVEEAMALEQVGAMTLLQERNKNLKIISFAKEPSSKVKEYLRQNPMEIDVIANGEVFGQMAYGASMGNPRMFIIDEYGIIRAALPKESFADNSKLLISLESILNGQ